MDNIADILSSLSADDISYFKSMAESLFSSDGEKQQSFSQNMPDPDMIVKISNVVNMMNSSQGGARSRLIEALKPNLSEKRQKKADEAIEFLKLMDILPLLNGLFGGDKNGK